MSFLRLYLIALSALICAWWILLVTVPESRPFFIPRPHTDGWLMLFFPIDLLTAAGSAVAGIGWMRYSGRVGMAICLTGLSSQTLVCWISSWKTGSAWLGAILMLHASVATLACAGAMLASARPRSTN